MNKLVVLALAIITLLTGIAEAQQPEKTRWIGYLTGSGSSPNQAFVQGLRELGYIEGKNIAFVFRTDNNIHFQISRARRCTAKFGALARPR